MTEILLYIGRLKNCGLGKQKALEFLEKFVDMKIAEQEAMEKMFDNFREDLDEDCDHKCDECQNRCNPWHKGYNYRKGKDLVEVVRCKNCKHHGGNEYYIMCDKLGREVEPDWFCADGKEKKHD